MGKLTRNRLCSVTLLLVLFSFALYAQPSDVYGWQKTHWGMTPSQLVKAYGSRLTASKAESGKTIYSIDNYEIFNSYFSVSFQWRHGKYLDGVSIYYVPGMRTFGPSKRQLGEKIQDELISRYGSGTLIKHAHRNATGSGKLYIGGSTDIVMRWTFPSTIITYTFSEAEFSPAAYASTIRIDYEQNEGPRL